MLSQGIPSWIASIGSVSLVAATLAAGVETVKAIT